MKTMKLGGTYVRVEEKMTATYLDKGYKYCAKSEWKVSVRDVRKAELEKIAAEKAAERAAEKAQKSEKTDKKVKKDNWSSKK